MRSDRGDRARGNGCRIGRARGAAGGAPGRAAYRLRQDCGSCHGMTLKGGLGPALLPDALAAHSEDDLAAVIVNGVPGTPMPPWDFEISGDEARWLARQLKQGLDDAG
ncbi:MAG TPA: cytochrome c [Geminicoccaceae bacterium]|nr:cytochrome c [Geminicoccaceae bacterium]